MLQQQKIDAVHKALAVEWHHQRLLGKIAEQPAAEVLQELARAAVKAIEG